MSGKKSSFRVGKVRGDLRGKVWYLTYHENAKRRRPRVGPDKEAARQLAAQVNSQLEVGAPTALSFEPITIAELQQRWLGHHEDVLRSSVQTIRRYRSATNHLLEFIDRRGTAQTTSHFLTHQAEEFVRYLRTVKVAPNGHPKARKRSLLDKGVKYILMCCRTLFNYAIKRRHLSPYAENPFAALDLDRMPIENAKPITIFSAEEEREFLGACDDWQLPLFLTLILTGLRPGELTHLLLPDDVDLEAKLLRICNKPRIGWQVKTRNEREIPLVEPLVDVLRILVGESRQGVVFRRRCFEFGTEPPLAGMTKQRLEIEVSERVSRKEVELQRSLTRQEWLREAQGVWRDAGMIKNEGVRKEFMRLTRKIGQPQLTAPKSLRHLFATCLQDANVDPLIRCELMGHSVGSRNGAAHGLGMTATYTHTRPETKRRQLDEALAIRPAVAIARAWAMEHTRSDTLH
jgi:integrase